MYVCMYVYIYVHIHICSFFGYADNPCPQCPTLSYATVTLAQGLVEGLLQQF